MYRSVHDLIRAGDIAQLTECLPNKQEDRVQSSILHKMDGEANTCNPSTKGVEAGDQEFKISLGSSNNAVEPRHM